MPDPVNLFQFRKTICAPGFTADSMMYKKKSVWIVGVFYCSNFS